jgi:DNA-binding CsgD family transcriptional regulator
VLSKETSSPISRIMALVALGRVRARRGDPEIDPVLDEALALALPTATVQRLAPVHSARAEAAWLAGDADRAAREAAAAFELAVGKGRGWFVGDLACWRKRAGDAVGTPVTAAPPFALELVGNWREAAAAWDELGCPYEAALARLDGDEAALMQAHTIFQDLGSRPAAAIAARKLRELGVQGVPRGPRPKTRANPANLTARELEVVPLLLDGLRNAEIADRLFVSTKTVDHHVSNILGKLGIHTRNQISVVVRELGIAEWIAEGREAREAS